MTSAIDAAFELVREIKFAGFVFAEAREVERCNAAVQFLPVVLHLAGGEQPAAAIVSVDIDPAELWNLDAAVAIPSDYRAA